MTRPNHTPHRTTRSDRRTARPFTTAFAAALVACAFVVGCGGGSAATTAPPTVRPVGSATINATPSFAFAPASLTVVAGDTVAFAFGTVAHNVFFDPQAAAPADIAGSNASVSVPRVFTTAGTFRYTCHIHPQMVGTVVVTARSPSGSVGGG